MTGYIYTLGYRLINNAIWLQAASLLAVRLWIAEIFFMSGLTKTKNWTTTLALFEDEYKVPLLSHEIAAYIATSMELVLPLLLILGLMTPFSAIGLLVMTLVIEIFIYPNTTEHYYWLLLLGILFTHGSGRFGLDYWILKRIRKYPSI